MKKSIGIIGVVCTFLLSACSTINTIQLDRLEAAEVSFPSVIRTVGVVNNTPLQIGTENDMSQTSGILEGEGKVMAEALAQGIASLDYFDQVIISDTSLCDMKVVLRSQQSLKKDWPGNVLSAQEATEWIEKLGVDVLLAVERIRIELKEGEVMGLMGPVLVVDGIVTPVLRAYVPGREKPLFTITKSDTIFWEPHPSLTFKHIVEDASEYAASLVLPALLPYWKQISRNYYDGGGVEMRDAGVYLREHNWEEAYALWKKVYDQKKGKSKMQAAFNLAFYHEMQGDFEAAKKYLEEARKIAKPLSLDEKMIQSYLVQLVELERGYQQLRIQMKRFDVK